MDIFDSDTIIDRNKSNFAKYGYSPASLDWNKGKQDIRFSVLTQFLDYQDSSILDIGCGFGDLLKFLIKDHWIGRYTGVDLVDEFITEAREQHGENPNADFIKADFLSDNFNATADFAVASGTFNYNFKKTDNKKFIKHSMEKAFDLSRKGIAFDFLSSKVDYEYEYAWYSNPSEILEFAYSLSRNVILRNDYMPFEFAVIVFKDDSFDKEDTLFHRYKEKFN